MRWAVCLQYDGSLYRGWQRQPGQPSVQAGVEAALSIVAGDSVAVQCAGRTDAGVHALAQVVSFDTTAARTSRAWVLGGNSRLPPPISLLWACEVAETFHARFSAQARCYRFVIWNAVARAALLAQRVAWVRWPLDDVAMNAAAQALVGEQDFSAFRAANCQSRTPMRCVFDVRVWRREAFVIIDIRANAFLQHMVRNIAGSLIEIGRGRQSVDWLERLLRGRDRRLAGPAAPAAGLYFLGPEYVASWALPPLPQPWLP